MTFRTLNIFLCIIHLLLAIGFTIYFYSIQSRVSIPLDLTIRDHQLVGEKPPNYDSVVQTDPSLYFLEGLLIAFFVITAFFHGVYAATANTVYARMIKNQNNWMRWIEYGISSTLMIYIIAFSSGVKDLNTYILLAFLNVCMIIQGQSVEENHRRGVSSVIPLVTGFLLLTGEITVITKDFFRRVDEVKTSTGSSIPSWVPAMILVMFVFYSVFGFVSLINATTKVPYTSIEKTYLWLSLASKATLGAFFAYGLVQRATAPERTLTPEPTERTEQSVVSI